MVTSNSMDPIASRYLLLANILTSVRIEKLAVPEIVAIDCHSAVLDCEYSGAGDDVTLLWLYNGTKVYEWRQGTEPKVSGILDGRLDLSYRLKSADGKRVQKRAVRITELSPDLSGEYTCVVRSRGHEARLSKTMTVYSPERDFELTFSEPQDQDVIHIKCVAKRLYPQPDLLIEYNMSAVAQQQQRTWREGPYYDAECCASVRRGGEVACRLTLPLVDYTAITKKYITVGKQTTSACAINPVSYTALTVITSLYLLHA